MNNDLVFQNLAKIPKGKVITYKKLAEISKINSPRLIGKIIHNNQNPKKFPCHRVVRSDRTIASGYAFGGREEQIRKLKSEGIVFIKNKIEPIYFIS